MLNQYITASARVRAMESNTLDLKDIDRMLNSANAKDAFDVLQDNSFSSHINWVSHEDFENAIIKYLHEVKKQLTASCPQWWVINLISIWYDFSNIRLALRAYLKQESFDNILSKLSPLWTIEYKDIKDYAFENKRIPNDLYWIQSLRDDIIKEYSDNSDLKQVDVICDKRMLKISIELAQKLNSDLILDFYKKRIDKINILTSLRSKKSFNENLFIPWWNLKLYNFKWNTDETSLLIKNNFWVEIDSWDDSSFLNISSKLEDNLTKSLEMSKYIAYWQEVIFAFFWSQVKSTEIIRTIMVWKINDIDKQVITDHLRIIK